MKWLAFLLCSFSCWAGLADVKSVYVMSMRHGLDQHLANRLTNAGVFQVVTDPMKADAVFTDQLGDAFEDSFKELFVPPEPAKKPEEKAVKEKDKDAKPEPPAPPSAMASNPMRVMTASRSKGNVFLVDIKTRTVLWSAYHPPKDAQSKEVDRAASQLVQSLQHALKPKSTPKAKTK